MALGVTNALCNRILAVNQRRGKLGRVDFAAAHFEEMGRAVGKRLLDKCVEILNAPDGGNRKIAEVGTNNQRLGFGVGNTADTEIAVHFVDIAFKLGAERCVFNVVNRAFKSLFAVNRHTAAARAEVRMVIGSEKQVKHTVTLGRYAKKTTHIFSPSFTNVAKFVY